MKPIDILNKIISTDGQCDFGSPKICSQCPLSKLKQKDTGTYYGCLEAIGVAGLKGKEVDEKYLEAAQKKLLELEMDNLLGDKIDTK